MNEYKEEWAVETEARTLDDAMAGADVFVGLSVAGMVSKEMVASMADNPIIFALANPVPEILPEEVAEVRSDAIMATGRSDYPNQVNNVLGFPFIFRGALDVRARSITPNMMLAATHALADLARQEVPESVMMAYGGDHLEFGREYIIPKPFDPRVLFYVAPAVAKAAMEDGVSRIELGPGRVPGSPEGQPGPGHGGHAAHGVHGPEGPRRGWSFLTATAIGSFGLRRRWWRRGWRFRSSSGRPERIQARAMELGVDLTGVEIVQPAEEEEKRGEVRTGPLSTPASERAHSGRGEGSDVQGPPFRRE